MTNKISAGKSVTVEDIRNNVLPELEPGDQLRGRTNVTSADQLWGKAATQESTGVQTNGHRKKRALKAKNILQKAVNNTINNSTLLPEEKERAKAALGNVATDAQISGTMHNEFLEKKNVERILDHVDTVIQEKGAPSRMVADEKVLAAIDKSKLSSIDENERVQLLVATSQGAAAQLGRTKIHTDSCASCCPIVLYNSTTGVGALFHIPAPEVEGWQPSGDSDLRLNPYDQVNVTFPRPGVRGSLKELFELVQPDEVHLFPGGHGVENEQPNLNELPIIDNTDYLHDEIESIMDEANINRELLNYHRSEGTSQITITEGPSENLEIYTGSHVESENEVDLFKTLGDLPEELSGLAIVRSHAREEDKDILLSGSAMLSNVDLVEEEEAQSADIELAKLIVAQLKDRFKEFSSGDFLHSSIESIDHEGYDFNDSFIKEEWRSTIELIQDSGFLDDYGHWPLGSGEEPRHETTSISANTALDEVTTRQLVEKLRAVLPL
ncbi:MAG: hypothetical protein AAF526_04940 [Pseudomonadota bacterium]